jgi:anti-sigma regulatory factor (Ser/Thr protein kinase)
VGGLLIGEWLGGVESLPMLDEASVALLRERVRELAASLALTTVVTGSLVNVASELGHNQLAHARGGSIALRRIERDNVPGIEIIAADRGDGILEPRRALEGRPRVTVPGERSSLGIGLSAVLELADEVDFDTRIGEGTCVWARKFAAPVSRRREVGIYGHPHPGERVSGDHGTFSRLDGALVVGVADGLGHGPQAREASQRAIELLREESSTAIELIVEDCHAALADTRGAVMALARIPEPGGRVETACAGNVSIHLVGPGQSRHVSGPSRVLGAPGQARRAERQEHELGSRDVVALYSDGLVTKTDLEGELDLLREHPIVIAHELVKRFGRDNDDVLVLVAR